MQGHAHQEYEWLHQSGWWLVPVLMHAFILLTLLGATLVWLS